jgi:hypothetical protein
MSDTISNLINRIEYLEYENRELKRINLESVYISQRQYDELMLKVRKAELFDVEYKKLKAELESLKNTAL